MVKFASAEDQDFQAVLFYLKRFLNDAPMNTPMETPSVTRLRSSIRSSEDDRCVVLTGTSDSFTPQTDETVVVAPLPHQMYMKYTVCRH